MQNKLCNENFRKLINYRSSVFVLLSLVSGPKKIIDIHKTIDTTYHCAARIVNMLEDMGLVTTKKIGRARKAELTELGQKVALLFQRINRLLRR